MADIPYMDKLEIKMMAEALYEIDKFRFAWTQKFLDTTWLHQATSAKITKI